MAELLRNEYHSKCVFIKEFIALCRELRHKQPVSVTECVKVCGEPWVFTIRTGSDKVSTQAWLYRDEGYVPFPMTTWGAPYSRWDSELREFLMREICKV